MNPNQQEGEKPDMETTDNRNENKQANKGVTKKEKVTNSKPANYKETEQLARKLINASGINYYEWLDEKHKEIIFEQTLKNQDKVVDALEKGNN